MAAAIEARVAGIVAATGRIAPGLLTPDAVLADLGMDSVTMVEIFFAIEEALEVTLPIDMGADPVTFAHLCKIVADQVDRAP